MNSDKTSENADKSLKERGLYVTDRELHQLINPNIGWDRFRAKLRVAELRGFPKVSIFWGGRYWPKVRAWLDNENCLADHDTTLMAEDGQENFDGKPRQNSRSKTQSVGKTVLDGAAADPRPARVSRPLHSVTGGR